MRELFICKYIYWWRRFWIIRDCKPCQSWPNLETFLASRVNNSEWTMDFNSSVSATGSVIVFFYGWFHEQGRWSEFCVLIGYPSGQDGQAYLACSGFPALSRKKRVCFGHNDIINLLTTSLFGQNGWILASILFLRFIDLDFVSVPKTWPTSYYLDHSLCQERKYMCTALGALSFFFYPNIARPIIIPSVQILWGWLQDTSVFYRRTDNDYLADSLIMMQINFCRFDPVPYEVSFKLNLQRSP